MALVAPSRAPTDADWAAAAAAVRAGFRPGDLIVAAPAWADPILRVQLGRPDPARGRGADGRRSLRARLGGEPARRAQRRGASGATSRDRRRFGRLRVRLHRAPAGRASPTTSSRRWADARVSRRDAGRRRACTWRRSHRLSGAGQQPASQLARSTRSCGRRCSPSRSPGAAVVIEFPAVPLGRALVIATGLHDTWMRKAARGTVEARLTVGDQTTEPPVTSDDSGWTRDAASTPRPRRADRCPSRWSSPRPRPTIASSPSRPRRADDAPRPARRRLAGHRAARARDGRLAARRRGAAGDRARRGASTCARASATGAGSRSSATTSRTAARALVHPVGHRSLLERQRARSPGRHEGALRALLARVPPCTCMGATRGFHPVPVPGGHGRCRCSRATRRLFASRPSCSRRCWSALVYRFARGWLRAAPSAVAAVLTLAQPHFFFHAQIACFDAPIVTMAFAVGFGYWKSLRDPRWGIATGALFGVALGVKHNAWLIPFFLVAHYLWMRRGRSAGAPADADPAGVRLDAGARAAHLLRALALALGGAGRAHARLRAAPPRARALQLRVPRPQLQPAADDHGDEVAARHRALRRDAASPSRSPRWRSPPSARSCWRAAAAARPSTPTPSPKAPTAERPSWLRPGADVDRAPGAFVLFQTLGPLAVLAVPSTPIFGGVKHFLAAMPYLAVMAGDRPRRPRPRAGARAARRRALAPPRGARRAGAPGLPARARRDAPLAPRRPRRTTTCWRAASPAARRWA